MGRSIPDKCPDTAIGAISDLRRSTSSCSAASLATLRPKAGRPSSQRSTNSPDSSLRPEHRDGIADASVVTAQGHVAVAVAVHVNVSRQGQRLRQVNPEAP